MIALLASGEVEHFAVGEALTGYAFISVELTFDDFVPGLLSWLETVVQGRMLPDTAPGSFN